jgi:hypothetical protein
VAGRLRLVRTGVPDKALSDIGQGWSDYYIGPMKQLLEN